MEILKLSKLNSFSFLFLFVFGKVTVMWLKSPQSRVTVIFFTHNNYHLQNSLISQNNTLYILFVSSHSFINIQQKRERTGQENTMEVQNLTATNTYNRESVSKPQQGVGLSLGHKALVYKQRERDNLKQASQHNMN